MKEKQISVQSQQKQLDRLLADRSIIETRREKAANAYYKAEKQRTEMILHYERSQGERNMMIKEESEWRAGQREAIERMTDTVRFLSTTPVIEKRFRGDSVLDNQQEANMQIRELQAIQRKIMQSYMMKERLEARDKVNTYANNINGGVDDAAKNLTMITKDTADEVVELRYQLEKAQDETVERERKLRQQASKIKEL